MKIQNNNQAGQQVSATVPLYQENSLNDEIDLRELCLVIWRYRWLTTSMCICAIIGSALYSFYAQEWWVAKGNIIEPQLNDVASLYEQAEEVKAILKAGNIDSKKNTSNKNNINIANNTNNTKTSDLLSDLFIPNVLFKNFTNEFNSSSNKKYFLENNSSFLAFLNENEIKVPTNEEGEGNQLVRENYSIELNNWLNGINGSLNVSNSVLNLNFRSYSKDSSSRLLNQYITFISNKVKDSQLEKFNLFVEMSKNELVIEISMLEAKAKQTLASLILKTKLSYQIASAAGLEDFQSSYNLEEDLFQINLGTKALESKIDVLKSITDLGLLDPNISNMKFTLSSLEKLKSITDSSFVPFQYLDKVEPPLDRAKPKRALIIILATLLAAMLSIIIALIYHFFAKTND